MKIFHFRFVKMLQESNLKNARAANSYVKSKEI